MKKLILIFAGILIAALINAQSLEEIVKKYTVANKLDDISKFQTLKVTINMSMPSMGMEMPMERWMKNPDKVKQVMNINGQEVIQVFDGEKGYSVNPMAGSTTPTEMPPDELNSLKSNNMFQNELANYLKEGKLTLEGEEAVNGAPAFKLKASISESNTTYIFIDKSSFYATKMSSSMTSQGMPMTIDMLLSDYKEMNGVVVPGKTTMSAQGMEFVLTYTNIEVNIPMDDSIFKLK